MAKISVYMWQRRQTLYLFLAFLCIVSLLFLPMFQVEMMVENEVFNTEFNAYGLQNEFLESDDYPLYLLYSLMALLPVLAILFYKKRPKQLLITRLTLVFYSLIATAFLIFSLIGKSFLIKELNANFAQEIDVKFHIGWAYYLLFISISFLFLAIRGIKADEELVKSLDRLR